VAVLKPRERLVYFRVSEDEFRQFVSVCEQAGARSVSDLARNAVQRLIAEGQRQRDGHELEEKMQMLERPGARIDSFGRPPRPTKTVGEKNNYATPFKRSR
jgi:hypothetical protein